MVRGTVQMHFPFFRTGSFFPSNNGHRVGSFYLFQFQIENISAVKMFTACSELNTRICGFMWEQKQLN